MPDSIKRSYPYPLYLKSDIQSLLDKIDSLVLYPNENDFSNYHTFAKTIYRLYGLKFTAVDLIKAILKRDIFPKYKQKEIGFRAYLFDIEAVSKFIKIKLKKSIKTGIQIKEYAKKLKIDQNALYAWVNKGYIKTIDSGNLRIGRLIPFESVAEFEKKYVLLTHVAKETKQDHSFLLRFLCKTGVIPVSGTTIDGANNYLFLRSQIDQVVISS